MKQVEGLGRLRAFYAGSVLALRVSAAANLALLAAVGLLAYALRTVKSDIASWKPVVIRVDEGGRAVPVDIAKADSPGTELETKVFCAEYVSRIQSYDPNSAHRDIALALYCTDEACSRQLVAFFQTDKTFQAVRQSGAIIQCTVNAVQILRSTPWEVRVDYTLSNLQTQQKRTWYALLTAKNCTRSFGNPFGLLVTGVRINTTIE